MVLSGKNYRVNGLIILTYHNSQGFTTSQGQLISTLTTKYQAEEEYKGSHKQLNLIILIQRCRQKSKKNLIIYWRNRLNINEEKAVITKTSGVFVGN